MTAPRKRWQDHWRLSADRREACHASGLRVRLEGGQGMADNAAAIEQAFVPQHGAHNAPAMVRRLLREGAQMLIDPNARGWRA